MKGVIRNFHGTSPAHRSGGVSLIEMLIALLVLSFGLLGVAGLQAQSLKNNQSAYLRSQANFLAYEIIDRMRANRADALNNAYNRGDPDDPDTGDLPTSSDSTNRAADDLYEWGVSLSQLPSGLGAVKCLNGVCTVGVEWDDSRGAGGGAESRILVSAGL